MKNIFVQKTLSWYEFSNRQDFHTSPTFFGSPIPLGRRGGNEGPHPPGQKSGRGRTKPWREAELQGDGNCYREVNCYSKLPLLGAPHLTTPYIPSLHRQEGLHKPKQPTIVSPSPGRRDKKLQADELGSGLLFQGPELALVLAGSWKASIDTWILVIKMMQYMTRIRQK